MKSFQTTLCLVLITHLLLLSAPASFLGLTQEHLSVRLYLDEVDQDEDIFIEVGNRVSGSFVEFHDESRRDTGRSLKLLVKKPVKWITVIHERLNMQFCTQEQRTAGLLQVYTNPRDGVFHPPPSHG